MLWYIVICILMLYPLSIDHVGNISGKKTQRVALMAACLILWFFMAMRSTSVGVDTKFYSHVFTQFSEIPLLEVFTAETFATDSETWSLDFEYGYRLYNKLISWISGDPQTITICNSSLIIALLYYVIKKRSPHYLLSIWLYITLGIYQTEMNVARNAIAILIVYAALHYVERKQVFRYILFCLIAASFHKAALVFILLYWPIRKIHWNQNRIIGCILVSLAVGILFPMIEPVLSAVLPYSVTRYFNSTSSKLESIIVGVFYLALFVMIYCLMDGEERKRVFSRCSMGTTMFVINLCCFALCFGIGYAARLAALFGPYMIIYIPRMLDVIESRSKKQMITGLVILACGCQYILRLCINNIGGTMPYAFFWQ